MLNARASIINISVYTKRKIFIFIWYISAKLERATTGCKNYDIEIRTLRKCNSMPEAEYWETIFIREYKKILGDRLLNIKK